MQISLFHCKPLVLMGKEMHLEGIVKILTQS